MFILYLPSFKSQKFIPLLDKIFNDKYHTLKQRFYFDFENRKLINDIYVVKVFDEDRIAVRVIKTDINNKFKYYGVGINE